MRSPAQRFSQQKTHQASFLGNQSQDNPVDVEVPEDAFDATIDSQPTVAVSTTGSPSSGSADIAMCPPVGDAAGDGFTSTGVPAGPSACLEVFLRELAVRQTEQFTILTNRSADIQQQLRELTDVTAQRSECAPNRHGLLTPSVAILLKPFWLKTFLSTTSAVALLIDQDLGCHGENLAPPSLQRAQSHAQGISCLTRGSSFEPSGSPKAHLPADHVGNVQRARHVCDDPACFAILRFEEHDGHREGLWWRYVTHSSFP